MIKHIPHHVLTTCKTINKHGFTSYVVGGAVRDILLNKTPTDWDLTTNALPDEIEKMFKRTFPTGKEFGTISTVVAGQIIEITTMRSDGLYTDSRHPDSVVFTHNIEQDLSRRDFTINAIAYDPLDRKLVDPFSGQKHLRKKMLVTVGDPRERFQEDPLRMLRLLRFQSTLGFKLERKTKKVIPQIAKKINTISAERILVELNKMLLGENLRDALENFYLCGLLDEVIPELAAGFDVSPGNNHPYDLLGHAINSAHYAHPTLPLRWAALLHDVGKNKTLQREHEKLSAQMAEIILRRLKASNDLIKKVTTLIGHHMYDIHPQSRDKTIRKFIAKVGCDVIYDLILLRQADMSGMNQDPRLILKYGTQMTNRLDQIIQEDNALSLKELKVNGHILIKELNLEPGPKVGNILEFLLEKVLEDPTLNTKNKLLIMAQTYLELEP